MKMHIIPIVMYAQQRLRGSALPTEELLENKCICILKTNSPNPANQVTTTTETTPSINSNWAVSMWGWKENGNTQTPFYVYRVISKVYSYTTKYRTESTYFKGELLVII